MEDNLIAGWRGGRQTYSLVGGERSSGRQPYSPVKNIKRGLQEPELSAPWTRSKQSCVDSFSPNLPLIHLFENVVGARTYIRIVHIHVPNHCTA